MFQLSSLRRQEGFTFNEVLISIALIAIGILGFSLNTVSVIQGNHVSGNITTATNLAQDKMEELKAQMSFKDMDNCPDAGDRSLTATGAPGGIYDRCWAIKDSSIPGAEGLKEVSVTVRWRDYLPREVSLSTLVFTR
jgi:Tfp pilus assembly protein PilV